MRGSILKFALALVFVFATSAGAANVFIDAEVTSLGADPDVVEMGDNFTIDIYMQNSSGSVINGFSCTWTIFSPTGNNVTYTDLGGAMYGLPSMIMGANGWLPSYTPGAYYWTTMNIYTMFNMDGALPDTFNHTTAGIPPNAAWPVSDNTRKLRFKIGMNSAQAGTICIDSINYAPNSTYDWLWAQSPEWVGNAFCFNVIDPNAPQNDPPVLGAIGDKTVAEGATLVINLTATDPQAGDVLTFSVDPAIPNATLVNNGNRTATYTFNPGYTQAGSYPVTFSVSDGTETDNEAINITVTNTNRPPTMTMVEDKTVNEGASLVINLTANDPDGDPLTFDVDPDLANATLVDHGNGTATYTFNPDYTQAGEYPVEFSVTDGPFTAYEEITITVNDVNQPPILAAIGNRSVDENATLIINLSATDGDGDILAFGVDPILANASLTDNGNGTAVYTFTPDYTQAGDYPVEFSVMDGTDGDAETITITVNNVNRAPELSAIGNRSVDEGGTLVMEISGTDVDGDELAFAVDPAVPNASLVNNFNNTATYTFEPDFTQAGDIAVTFYVTDGDLEDEETITITVNDVNQVPVLSSIGDQGVEVGNTLAFNISAYDLDGTTPTLHAEFLPDNAGFDDNLDGTASFYFTPEASQVGQHEILFYATDGALADSEYVMVTVTMGNVAPVLDPIGNKSVAEGEQLIIDLSAFDGNGDDLTFSVNPVLLNAVLTDHGDGTATYAFDPDFTQANVYNVTFAVTDGVLDDDEMIEITVTNVNRAPVAVEAAPMSVDEGNALNFTFEASDPDNDLLFLSVEDAPLNSDFNDNGDGTGDFVFNPDFQQADVYIIRFIASDGPLADTINLEVTVNNVPQAPVLDPIGDQTVLEGETLGLLISATDLDGDILIYSVDPELENATFTNNHNNTYSYIFTPGMDQAGEYDVTFSVTDGVFTDEETITITVIDVVPVEIITDPMAFNVTLTEGQTANFGLDVYESIDRNIDFTITEGVGWVNIIPSSSPFYTTPMTFNVNLNTVGLVPGDYNTDITISEYGDGGQFEDVIVPVNLTVNALSTMPDSVWISSVPGIPGNDAVVPVYFKTETMLSAINLPITWNSNHLVLDAVTFDGTLVEDYDTKSVTINNASRRAMITIAPIFNGPITPGRGMMAKLHFSILETALPGFVFIDTTTIIPGGGLTFVDEYYNMITPTFIKGTVIIGSDEAFVCGRVIDIYGNEIENATVELWNDFPAGALISSHLTDVNGQFACESESIFPFDAYAYKEGYYPGTLEDIQVNDIGFDIVLTPVDMPIGSPYWVTFYCDNNTYYNVPLPVGAVVDAYDPDGVHCGTVYVTEPGKFTLAVFGDEIMTPDEDEGAEAGETIDLFINGLPAKSMGNNTWTGHGDRIEVCLDLESTEDRFITLHSGWNLISWNVDTPIDDIDQVLEPVYDCIDVVLGFNQGGFTFDPALLDFSTLWEVDHMHGYWVKIKDDCGSTVNLPITGVPVAATTPIVLNAGWNLVSYLPNEPDTVIEALGSINDNLIIALGYDGVPMTYDPDLANYYWTLQHLATGYGYWLKMVTSDVLIYPGAGPIVYNRQPFALNKAATIDRVATSRVWMNVYSHELVLDNEVVISGAEVLAMTADDRIVGRAVVRENGKFGFMAIYGDDPTTEETDGLTAGEKFYLVVDGVRTSETFTWSEPGAKEEIFSLSSSNGEPMVPAAYSLSQNYPNPFNPSTNIVFSVPSATHVTVEVYNILGMKVATIFDDMANAGENIVTWNGTDQSGNNVASGVYFYRMQADDFVESCKMVLMK